MTHTIKVTFNLDTESADKARTIVNNVDKALVKKKMLMFGSKKIDTVKNTDIHYIYNDFYLSEKSLKADAAKKADVMALAITTKENAIKTTLGERFAIPLDFHF